MSDTFDTLSAPSLDELARRLDVWSRGARDVLWDWDMDTDRVVYSEAFWTLVGEPEERIERRSTWFKRVHSSDFASLEEDMEHYLSGRSSRFENRHRLLDRNSNYVWVLACGVALRDENGLVTCFGGSLTDISVEHERDGASVRELFYDLLTELPNRKLFMARLEQSMQRRERVEDYIYAVLVIGIDQLEQVHQDLGEIAADQLMVEIADRLRASTRKNDTIGRVRGDEFTILLDNVRSCADALRFAQRLSLSIGAQISLRGEEIQPVASIGIAVSEDPYETALDVLRAANSAMIKARADGGGELMANEVRHEEAERTLREEQSLSEALDAGALGVTLTAVSSGTDGQTCCGIVRIAVDADAELSSTKCWELALSSGLLGSLSRQVIGETLALRDRLLAEGQATPLVLELPLAALATISDEARLARMDGVVISLSQRELQCSAEAVARAKSTLETRGLRVAVRDFGRTNFSLPDLMLLSPELVFLEPGLPAPGEDALITALAQLASACGFSLVASDVNREESGKRLKELGIALVSAAAD